MRQRERMIQRLKQENFDVLVIGGGINGAVAASALATQGVRVALVDQGDIAVGSSSQSSNLAWGGIKYMETGELLLVQKLCRSRNHLMDNYPSRVKEIRFYTTINRGFRWPAWIIYCGACLYWLMGACRTQPPRFLRQRDIEKEQPIIDAAASVGGVEYSDCYLPGNDARFVFNFVRSAIDHNAAVANYVNAVVSKKQTGDYRWQTILRDCRNGEEFALQSNVIINACGPSVDYYNDNVGQDTRHRHVFSKGVHLIVPRLIEEEKILAFFASDGRLFFVIPMGQCTCIGTTDTRVDSPEVVVSEEDRQFILDNANQLLKLRQALTKDDIIAERCGVRPLVVKRGKNAQADWLKLSRKHKIYSNHIDQYLSVYGGKITDCINVGEEILDHCRPFGVIRADHRQKWYGEPAEDRKQQFLQAAAERINLDVGVNEEPVAERWWRRFGELAYRLLDRVEQCSELLERPLPEQDYCAAEIALMAEEECIVTLEDFLRRRTKIALTMKTQQLLSHPGLNQVATLLFGADDAEGKISEYRQSVGGEMPSSINAKALGA